MAQSFTPPPSDPYDADADEHPEHTTAPPSDIGGSSNPNQKPLFEEGDPNGDIADQEKSGDDGVSPRRPSKEQSKEAGKAESPSSVKGSEEKGGGWFRPDEDGNKFQRGRSKLNKGKGQLSKYANNKLLVGGVIGGGGGIVIAIILLVLIAGSLKIPNLAEHITTYEMARVLRQSVETDSKITNERLAVDSLTQRGYDYARNSYQGLRDNTWGKFDKYRPQQVIKKMKGEDKLKLNYGSATITGRQQLRGVTVANQTFLVENQGASRFIPGFSQVVKFKNGVTFSKNFSPALSDSLKANNIGPIIRGRVANQVRQELKIGLVAYVVGSYKGKSEAKARLQAERDSFKKVAQPGVDDAVTKPVKDTVEKAERTLQQDLDSDEFADNIIANNGMDPKVAEVIEEGVSTSNFQKVVGGLNATYSTGMAICIIYDGSITKSAPTINAMTASQQRLYYLLATAGDQQKTGDTTGEAVGAFDGKFGNIAPSNPEVRAAGGTVDTSDSLSAENSAGGSANIIGTLFGHNFAADALSKGLDAGCPAVTDPVVGTAGAVALAALAIIPGFGQAEAGANAAADATAATLTQRLVASVVAKFGSREAAKTTISQFNAKARFIGKDVLKSGVKVGGLTVLAKLIVMSKAHQTTNGLEQNSEAANNADSGANIHGNVLMQKQFYGRPMTTSEVLENDLSDDAFIKSKTQSLPAGQRYFALSNPDSLLNRMATTTASTMRHSIFASFLSLGPKLLNPLGSMNNLFGSTFTPKSVQAATVDMCRIHYCNVQFGYSARELNVLRLDFTYRLLENKSLLEQSGEADAIETKYKDCYDKQIGDMIAEGLVVRDEKGNVDPDEGLCAPNHLAYDSTDPDFQPHMIFRWRVAHDYDNGLDQLLDQQTVTSVPGPADTITPGAPAAPGAVQEGSTADLAKKLLAYKDSGEYKCDNAGDCTDLTNVANNKNLVGSGCRADDLDPRVIQLLLYLIESGKFKIGTYALCGDHGYDGPRGHSGGFAVDISSVNGVSVSQNSAAAKANTLKLDKFLNNNLPDVLKLRQQISYGYGGEWGRGGHYDKDIADTQQASGNLCHATCVSFYTLAVEKAHTTHVHAGY